MTNKWFVTTLGEILTGHIRHGLYKPLASFGTGTRVLKMGLQYAENRIGFQEMPRTQLSDEEIERFRVNDGDLLFSRTSMMSEGAGKCSIAIKHSEPFVFDGNILCATVKSDIAASLFVFYYLQSPEGKQSIYEIIGGTQSRSLSSTNLSSVKISLPPLSEQHSITKFLDTLDDKIELNSRMNRTLESMARAVFRQWFVENEDVNSWEVKSLGEIVERVGMGPFGSSIKVDTFIDEGIPVINGQQLREFMLEDSSFKFISLEHAEKLKNANVYPGDIVLTHRGTLGQVSLIPKNAKYKRYIVSQSQFFVRCNLEKITPNFLIYYLRSPEGQHKLLANRSAVGVPAIARPVTYLRSIELAVPPKELLDAFEQIVAPLHSKYNANRQESFTLGSLRDSLLPKLMRGEVRVVVNGLGNG